MFCGMEKNLPVNGGAKVSHLAGGCKVYPKYDPVIISCKMSLFRDLQLITAIIRSE